MAENDVQQSLDLHEKMVAEKSPLLMLYQEIGDYVAPYKADFVRVFGLGQKRMQKIFDGTGFRANNIFASSVMAYLANPATKWFDLATDDEKLNKIQENKEWLEIAGRITLNNMNNPASRFYSSLKTTLINMGAFGTASLSSEKGQKSNIIFASDGPKYIYIAEGPDGDVNVVHKEWNYTVRQIMQNAEQKGWTPSKMIRDKEKGSPTANVVVIQCIYERRDYKAKAGPLSLPIASMWIERETKNVLFESGFHEFPRSVGRWDQVDGEAYGRGQPGEVALADIKSVNLMSKSHLVASEMIINPPLQAPATGSYGQLDLSPGAVNFLKSMNKGGKGVEPINVVGQIPITMEMEEARRKMIESAFFVNQLQLVSDVKMTATEVLEKTDENGRILSPTVGRLQAEILGPQVQRSVALLIRDGVIPPPPKTLQGREMKIIYVSPLTRIQRAAEAQAIISWTTDLATLGQIDPSVMDLANMDEAAKELHTIKGVPASVLRKENEVEGRRNQRQQEETLMKAGAIAETGAKVAKDAAAAGVV